jgi:hypothetical protein
VAIPVVGGIRRGDLSGRRKSDLNDEGVGHEPSQPRSRHFAHREALRHFETTSKRARKESQESSGWPHLVGCGARMVVL